MRRQVEHALVEQVDDGAVPAVRQQPGHVLHQQRRRAQVGLEMQVPARPAHVADFVALEFAGVVDQAADRPDGPVNRRQQRRRFGLDRKIRLHRRRPAAIAADQVDDLDRLALGAAVVDRHRPSLGRQAKGDRPADPRRRAGDKRGRGGDFRSVVGHGGVRLAGTLPAWPTVR